jgi:hypothetical protein
LRLNEAVATSAVQTLSLMRRGEVEPVADRLRA